MTTGRVLWIIWCLLWAAAWTFTLVGWPLAVLSLLAILLPVGRPPAPPRAACPVCGAAGEPVLLPMHMQAAHGMGMPMYGGPAIGGPAPQMPPRVIEQQSYGGQPPVRPSYGPPPGGIPPFSPPPPPPPPAVG